MIGPVFFLKVTFWQLAINPKLKTQCPRTELSKRFLPKPMTTTGWKGTPSGVKITMDWNPPHWVPLTKNFFKVFFRLTIFFSGTKKFFPRNNFCSVFYVLLSKKKFRVIWKFLKIFDFQKSLSKFGPTVEDFNSSWFWLLRGSPFTLW